MKTVSLLLCLLTACAKPAPADTEEFRTEIETFKLEGEARGALIVTEGLEIRIEDDIGQNIEGRCLLPQFLILIQRNAFERIKNSRTEREILLFHEFGHCILGRSHVHEMDHIMSDKNKIWPPKYEQNRSYFLDQLFRSK